MPSRRQLLARVGSAAAAGLSGCLGESGFSSGSDPDFSPGTDEDADWPMPRYDSTNAAYNPDAKAPREGVRERWTYEGGMATGSPAVADGTVFLPTSRGLVALDSTSGEKLWRYPSEEESWVAPPAVHDGVVYVTGFGGSSVHAVDAAEGEAVWSGPDAGDGHALVHLIAGEHVSDPVLYAGSRDGVVSRLDATTGERTWQTDLFGEISAFGYYFSSVYVGTYGGEVHAFSDTVDGVEEPGESWRRKVGPAVENLLVDEEGLLVSTFGGPLQCLGTAAHAGTTRWTVDEKWAGSAPVSAQSSFFAAGYDGFARIRENDGEVQWQREGRYDRAAPVAAGDTLYVADDDAVHAFGLDGDSGLFGDQSSTKRWSHPTPAGSVEGLAVADGAVFAACEGSDESDVTLYCLESPN